MVRPAGPAASAVGSKLTRTRPTSRGRVCCVSFRLGRWWEQTAAGSGAGACRLRRFLGVRVDGAFMMRHNVRRFCGIVIFAEERGFRPFLSLVHVYPDAEGKIERRGNDAALPRGGKGRCRCAQATLFALRAKALQSWRAGFWVVRGAKADKETVCPSRMVWPARRGNGSMPSCAP